MKFKQIAGTLIVLSMLLVVTILWARGDRHDNPLADGREEVVFWHFWGGADRDVVEDVVRRFNES